MSTIEPRRTWMPTTAGILSIITGAINILVALGFLVGFGFYGHMWGGMLPGMWGAGGWGIGAGIALAVIGVISVIGGIYSLQRRVWGMALAGAITSLFPPMAIVLGILAIIFVSLSKREFS